MTGGTKTIYAQRVIEPKVLPVAWDSEHVIRSTMAEVEAEVREEAVLLNAEGWQSGPIEIRQMHRDGLHDPLQIDVVVAARMVMTR